MRIDNDMTGYIAEDWYFPENSLHIHGHYVSEKYRNTFLQLLYSIRFDDNGSF